MGRRRAERFGRWAEMLAAALFLTQGYRILARRWRSPVGELDLVVRGRGRIVFAEVKARSRADDIEQAVAPAQRRRIAAAAGAFLAARPDLAGLEARFDAVLVAPWRMPRHLRDAWRP